MKRTAVLFTVALIVTALAADPAAPASAQACAIPDSGEYTLPGDCTLAGTIDVNGSLTIHGNGHTIDANNHRAFHVGSSESLALDNVTVTNGYSSSGGAIESYGTVTVSNSTFSGNSANRGGAIDNEGTATVSNSTFTGNSAYYYGGAIENYGTMTVSNSIFTGNSASLDSGAIDNLGSSLTVGGCSVFQGNTAGASGDGIGNYFGGTVDIAGSAIYDEIYHGSSATSTTAEGNWWGSAAGPGALANGFTVNTWWETNQCGTEGATPKCIAVVRFGTADPAPVSGEVRFFTDFGYDLPLRPEGWQMGAVTATAGEQTWGSVTVFCGNHVRAWLFDVEGNAIGLIPSQYENGDEVFTPNVEDYGVGGPEYGYVPAAPPMYAGRYAEMFAGE